MHVLEYLWAAAWCFHARDDPAAEDRVAVQALAVLADRPRQVTASLTAQAARHGLTESQRAGVETCVRYLENNREYLRYDQALASGWPRHMTTLTLRAPTARITALPICALWG